MKNYFLALFAAVVASVVGFRVQADDTIVSETNLVLAVMAENLNVTIGRPTHNSNHKADYLFNGKSWSPNANTELESFDGRYLDNITLYGTADKTGVWAQVTVPDAFHRGKRIVLKKYRLHRLAFWGNSINRAPTEWKIYGVRKDKTKVLLAYENLGPNHWTGRKEEVPEDEVNEFPVQNIDAAHEGFRSYRVEFINSHYTSNKEIGNTITGIGNFDLGLQELSLFVDIKEPQMLLTSNIDDTETKLQFGENEPFAPHLATTFNGPQTLTAPTRVNKAFHSYRLKGYRIEKNIGDTWITDSEITLPEGERSVAFTPSVHTNDLRVTWLYDEIPWYEDLGPVSFVKYLFAHGISQWELGAAGNYAYASGAYRLFDVFSFATSFLTDEDTRYIGSIYNAVANNTNLYVCAHIPEKILNDGHEFFITKYRPYSLSLAGNEIVRRPTAWTLQVTNATSNGQYVDIDSQTDVSWSTSTYNKEYQNYLEFSLENPVPFCALQLILKDSAAYQNHKDDNLTVGTGNNLDVGMMEFEVFVGVANPRGTLRVMTVLENLDQTEFSHPRGTLVNEPATLTAPQYGLADGKRHPCLGYRLETFNEATCTWIGGEVVGERSYSYVPDSTKRERLTWVFDMTNTKVEVAFQGEGNETVTVNVAGEDGSYYGIGDTLTIAAVGNTDDLSQPNGETNQFHSTFVRWVGDLDGLNVDPTSATITFTVDRPRKLIPLFTRDWLYYKTDGEWRIKDGNWDLGVYEITSASSTLALKSFAYRSGAGVLDLSTPIYHYQTGQRLTMLKVDEKAMVLQSSDYVPSAQITELTLPTELTSLGKMVFRSTGNLKDNADRFTLTNLVMNCPNLTSIGSMAFTRQYNLHKVQLNIPKCTTFKVKADDQYTFYAVSFKDTNFEEWDLSGLTTLCPNAFQHDGGNNVGTAALYSSGVLRMPALEGTIPANAFWEARQASGYEFGTAKGRISNIGAQAFVKNAATNFVLGSLPTLTVAPTAFSNKTAIANLTFVNDTPSDSTQLDNILFCNDAEAMANVYVSKLRDNWRGYVTPVDQIADEAVKAEALARGADGAYKSQGGVWKAFVFAQSMPLDPKGTIVIVR